MNCSCIPWYLKPNVPIYFRLTESEIVHGEFAGWSHTEGHIYVELGGLKWCIHVNDIAPTAAECDRLEPRYLRYGRGGK